MQKKKAIKFKAKGNSMKPIITEEDMITLSPYDQISPSSGDIVAYLHPSTKEFIIHRLIKKNDNSFIAKGDNCRYPDNAHEASCIIGHISQINKKFCMRNVLLLAPIKKILVFFSKMGLFLALNKFLKRIHYLL